MNIEFKLKLIQKLKRFKRIYIWKKAQQQQQGPSAETWKETWVYFTLVMRHDGRKGVAC